MIGVHTSEPLRPFAEEFFELFKTPWEYYFPGRHYDAVLCCGVEPVSYNTQLLLIYSGDGAAVDHLDACASVAPVFVNYQGDSIPIYTNRTIAGAGCSITIQVDEARPGLEGRGGVTLVVGYNLFLEVAFLLTCGQPAQNASVPALELHSWLLRDLLLRHTEYLVEIPPYPVGYWMIACLTHDVDHPSIRKQPWPTILGFLYRASLGSLVDLCRGRKRLVQAFANFRAALSLPLVYAGLADDCWDSFDAYTEIETPRPSTYFFIPTKGCAGRDRHGREHSKRAAAYAASECQSSITSLLRQEREIGVHGIEAWRDVQKATQEREAIASLTGQSELGIRMHWLYYDARSPAQLEQAGYAYDTTVGYNETVGFRAGTTQAFKPPGASRLFELPLHIMDTALFYPDYLHLTPADAGKLVSKIISQFRRFGGVLTVNWHDRSLAPERLWGDVYRKIIQQLSDAKAWFATCKNAVEWFRQRRSIRFTNTSLDADNVLRISLCSEATRSSTPPVRLRVHPGRGWKFRGEGQADAPSLDLEVCEASQEYRIPMQPSN